ncbi:hypothetical protein IC006_1025 [Sulfuracidifex tepidarius]|uniref:Uncharacterized protein n=1 Tax=Sulfuracidifex tepidarius TaxID=1294262 RepID=A0A510DUA0_9CREN|nr:hypothetical protein [Sulfuracidifex tepidarius]BBG23734.1 hypothetical protein IC006_1025 [Sulfuracidifex tepidarius]BBG26488.1 hypothetical protein IC007_0999 [Sulfuracidifex tepidarius]
MSQLLPETVNFSVFPWVGRQNGSIIIGENATEPQNATHSLTSTSAMPIPFNSRLLHTTSTLR